MNGLALCLFLAAADAPKAEAVDAGYVTPTAGTFLPAPLDVDTANRLQAAEARPGWAVVTLAGVAGLVVGAVVGGIVAAAAKK